MTVLHEVRANFVGGVLQRDQFKMVYVAPMKALAAEVTATFSRRLQGLGVVVRELTGDMQLTKKEKQTCLEPKPPFGSCLNTFEAFPWRHACASSCYNYKWHGMDR